MPLMAHPIASRPWYTRSRRPQECARSPVISVGGHGANQIAGVDIFNLCETSTKTAQVSMPGLQGKQPRLLECKGGGPRCSPHPLPLALSAPCNHAVLASSIHTVDPLHIRPQATKAHATLREHAPSQLQVWLPNNMCGRGWLKACRCSGAQGGLLQHRCAGRSRGIPGPQQSASTMFWKLQRSAEQAALHS
jgi:hypothetical protein